MGATASDLFFELANQYYVAGRAAAIAGLAPVYGNLLHHAVEMYLKAAIARTLSLHALKGIGHQLESLWRAFKKAEGTARLEQFDATITALEAFEEIRYPDKALQTGILSDVMGPSQHGSGILVGGSSQRKPPTYRVRVAEVDQLVIERLWPALGVRDGFVPTTLVHLTKDGRRAIRLRNRELQAHFRRARKRRPRVP